MSLSDEVGTRWVSDRVTIHSISTFGWLRPRSHPTPSGLSAREPRSAPGTDSDLNLKKSRNLFRYSLTNSHEPSEKAGRAGNSQNEIKETSPSVRSVIATMPADGRLSSK